MPILRDFRSVDTTYGGKQDNVTPVYQWIPDLCNSGQATVNGSATLRNQNLKRNRLVVFNLGGDILYAGSNGVNASNGFPIPPNEKHEFKTTSAIYVFSVAALDVRFLEELLGPDA